MVSCVLVQCVVAQNAGHVFCSAERGNKVASCFKHMQVRPRFLHPFPFLLEGARFLWVALGGGTEEHNAPRAQAPSGNPVSPPCCLSCPLKPLEDDCFFFGRGKRQDGLLKKHVCCCCCSFFRGGASAKMGCFKRTIQPKGCFLKEKGGSGQN